MDSPVELRSQLIWLDSDGILHAQVKPHVEITLEDAREALEQSRRLCAGKLHPVLVDLTNCKAISREARAYYAGEEAAKSGLAAALLLGSPLARVIGNFYMEFHKPVFPVHRPRLQQPVVGDHQLHDDLDGGPAPPPPHARGSGGKVRVDPGQMEQVLMNLAVNARDAMPSGGTLRIRTTQVEQLEDPSLAPSLEAPLGPWVLLRVSDTGVGMDEATKARIFEPFFTTKEPGLGTGLGLATVFGVVQQSGGSIRVLSEPGEGATFEVYLPRSAETGKDSPSSPGPPPVEGGSETILLVEDNDQVRQLIRRILEGHGYQVFDAAHPQEALALFERHQGSIQLLLTDVVMPQLSGRQLAEKLLASRRELKVLYMSGYTEDVALRHGIVEASVAFLQKPVTPDALLRKLREVLGPPPQGAPKP